MHILKTVDYVITQSGYICVNLIQSSRRASTREGGELCPALLADWVALAVTCSTSLVVMSPVLANCVAATRRYQF
jgi:hypothetical protein